jgi:hypothetical protein
LGLAVDELDRTRFQSWFYFYPSGFPIADISEHLATLLERLAIRHDFDPHPSGLWHSPPSPPKTARTLLRLIRSPGVE